MHERMVKVKRECDLGHDTRQVIGAGNMSQFVRQHDAALE